MNKPDTCSPCPLYRSSKGFAPDLVPDNPEYIFLAEALGRTEVEKETPLVGDAGFVFRQWMVPAVPEIQLALESGKVALCNTLRCQPPKVAGKPYPEGETRRLAESCCRQYDSLPLRRAIADAQGQYEPTSTPPTPVILLGDVPQRLLFGNELKAEDIVDRKARRETKGVLGRIGRVYHRGSHRYTFAPHPAYILRQPATVEHGQRALRISVDERKPLTPIGVSLDNAMFYCWRSPEFGLDLEWSDNRISIFGLSWDGGRKASAVSRSYETERDMKLLLDHANLHNKLVIAHNCLGTDSDAYQLRKEGFPIDGIRWFDTKLGIHATHTHLAGIGSYDIRSTVLLHREHGGSTFSLDWKRYDSDIWGTCRDDAAATLWASIPMRQAIAQSGLEAVCQIAHDAAPIFQLMHEQGVKLDKSVLERIHHETKTKQESLVEKYALWEWRGKKAPKKVPIWRSDKILDLFESRFGMRPANRQSETWEALAKDPKLSADAKELVDVLIRLGEGANDAHWLGQAEEGDDGLDFSKVDADGYIHPNYDCTRSPDRPIARDPNVQNFPRPADDPRSIPLRSAVIPPEPDMLLLSVDFSSVETYTNAIAAGDWQRVEDIQKGKLSHEATAEAINRVFGLTLSRQEGKTCNHAFDKGESSYNLAHRLFGDKSRKSILLAGQIYNRMLNDYPTTRRFRESLWEACRQNPYIARDAFGRRLKVFGRAPYGEGGYGNRAEAAIRDRWKKALAFLGRAPAVTCLMRVMIELYREHGLLPYIEVHDELVYAVPKISLDAVREMVLDCFQKPVPELGGTKLPAEAKSGADWSKCKD